MLAQTNGTGSEPANSKRKFGRAARKPNGASLKRGRWNASGNKPKHGPVILTNAGPPSSRVYSITGAAWPKGRTATESIRTFSPISAKFGRELRAEPVRKPGSLFFWAAMYGEAHFDHFQFEDKIQQPVSAGTGLSFEDYSRCQTMKRKTSGERRLEIPEWALDDTKMKRLVFAVLEKRLPRSLRRTDPDALKIQNLNEIEQRVKAHYFPIYSATMDRLCAEFVAERNSENPDRKRLRMLEIQIKNVDTSLLFLQNPAAHIIGIIYFYFRARLDSPGVAAELSDGRRKCTPQHVRQTLFRLHRTWEEIGDIKRGSVLKKCPSCGEAAADGRYCSACAEAYGTTEPSSKHLCRRCQRTELVGRVFVCDECRCTPRSAFYNQRRSKRERDRRAAWKAQGKCPKCGGDRENPKWRWCDACRAKKRA